MVIIGLFGLLETLFTCPMIMPSLDPAEGTALWGAVIHRQWQYCTGVECDR